jgi:hypothetical protein
MLSVTTLERRQCFTKEAFEKPKGAIKNVQYRDTGNIGHKTMFYNPETHVTLGTRQCFTKEALEKTKGTVKHEQSRDTDNIWIVHS